MRFDYNEKRCIVYQVDSGHGPYYWEVITAEVSDHRRDEIKKIWPDDLNVVMFPSELIEELSEDGWSVTVDSQAAYVEWLHDYHNHGEE